MCSVCVASRQKKIITYLTLKGYVLPLPYWTFWNVMNVINYYCGSKSCHGTSHVLQIIAEGYYCWNKSNKCLIWKYHSRFVFNYCNVSAAFSSPVKMSLISAKDLEHLAEIGKAVLLFLPFSKPASTRLMLFSNPVWTGAYATIGLLIPPCHACLPITRHFCFGWQYLYPAHSDSALTS